MPIDHPLQQASRDAFAPDLGANYGETPPRATPIYNPRLARVAPRKRRPWIARQLTITGWCILAGAATLIVLALDALVAGGGGR